MMHCHGMAVPAPQRAVAPLPDLTQGKEPYLHRDGLRIGAGPHIDFGARHGFLAASGRTGTAAGRLIPLRSLDVHHRPRSNAHIGAGKQRSAIMRR